MIGNNMRGFTLIELLVAMSIFTVAIVSASSLFIISLKGQRNIIAQQNLTENTRFVIERMSRHIRMAQRLDSSVPPACPADVFFSAPGATLTFIDSNSECAQYRLSPGLPPKKIQLRQGVGAWLDLTSNDISVNSLYFEVDGELPGDQIQPRVTIYIEADVPSDLPEGTPDIHLQTTVSTLPPFPNFYRPPARYSNRY